MEEKECGCGAKHQVEPNPRFGKNVDCTFLSRRSRRFTQTIKGHMIPAKIKVSYFPIKARAEPIRLALSILNIPFENEKVNEKMFREMKKDLPFAQLPILTVDGTVISQSTAILRYVGKLAEPRLYPEDPLKCAKVDELISMVQDCESALLPSGKENDPAKKLAMRKELYETTLPKFLGFIDRFIASNGGKFATSDSVTIGDLFLYQMNTSYSSGAYDGIEKDVLDPFLNIRKVVAAVKATPGVVSWETCEF